MSGLPDIGIYICQVGYSRLGWRVSKEGAATGGLWFETALSRLLTIRPIESPGPGRKV